MSLLFFFNDTATTEIYTLSLHDALPICRIDAATDAPGDDELHLAVEPDLLQGSPRLADGDRKSTRLNSSHPSISYAVFCLKKKKFSIIKINNLKDTVSTHCRDYLLFLIS